MKTIIIIATFFLMLFVFASCKKDSVVIPRTVEKPAFVYTELKWDSAQAGLMSIAPLLECYFGNSATWLTDHIRVELLQSGSNIVLVLPYLPYGIWVNPSSSLYFTIKDDGVNFWENGGPIQIFSKQNSGIDFSKRVNVNIFWYR